MGDQLNDDAEESRSARDSLTDLERAVAYESALHHGTLTTAGYRAAAAQGWVG